MKIKVISLNVWHGGQLWDEMIDFLQAEDADVLLLQEFHAELDGSVIPQQRTLQEFRKQFDYAVDDFAPTLHSDFEGVRVAQGNAIFTKLPLLTRHEPVFFDIPFNENYISRPENYPFVPRSLQHLTLDAAGTPFDVFNFHGVWDLDGTNDSPERLTMSQVIIDHITGLEHVLLAGDTNAQRDCRAILNIETQLSNVFSDELSTSFNLLQKDLKQFPGYATATVDMMFTSPHLKVVGHHCPSVNVSDHLPLVATVELPDTPPYITNTMY